MHPQALSAEQLLLAFGAWLNPALLGSFGVNIPIAVVTGFKLG